MANRPTLCYITDRTAFPGSEAERRRCLLEKIAEAGRAGIDYIQLREKDLATRDLEGLAREIAGILAQIRVLNSEPRPALLINSRTDVALAAGAAGVHLRSDDVSPRLVKQIWHCGAGAPARDPVIGVSCHSPEEVMQATKSGANFVVFAPVFGKKDAPDTKSAGLAQLEQACRSKIPVLALGGITVANAGSCLEAGAAGIAAIRLFQENEISAVVRRIRPRNSV